MRLPILSFCDFRSISVDTAAHCIYVCNKRHENRTRNKDMGAVVQTFRELSKIISRNYTMLEITSGRYCWYAVMGIVSLHFGLAVWYNWHRQMTTGTGTKFQLEILTNLKLKLCACTCCHLSVSIVPDSETKVQGNDAHNSISTISTGCCYR